MTITTTRAPALPAAARPASRRGGWGRILLISLVMAYMAFLILAPLVRLVIGAFEQGVAPVFSALSEPEVMAAFWLTIWISVITTAFHALFGTLVAWLMVRQEFPGKALINGLIDMPFAVSPVVVGYMLLLLFGRNGLLAPLLNSLGIKVAFAVPGMILATLFVTLPFMIRELMPVLRAFGIQQEQAAATLGASGWQIFWHVTLPAIRWGFIYGITLTFARALGEFGATIIFAGNFPGRTQTMPLAIYVGFELSLDVALTLSVILVGCSFLVLMVVKGLLHRELDNSGGLG